MSDERTRLELSESRELPRLDPGPAAVGIAVGVLVLLLANVLPWVGANTGWQVLSGDAQVGLLPRLFTVTSMLFGVIGSVAALLTRRWPIAWACAFGGGFAVVNGVWAVWSRQTAPHGGTGPGPGFGLVLAVIAMLVLTVLWVRLAWSRPGGRANG